MKPIERKSPADLLACAAITAVAVAVVFGVLWRRSVRGQGVPSFDIYAYSLPIYEYARSAWGQGHGLFWNDLQNCGQPFLGIPSTTVLYPLNWPFLWARPETWLLLQAVAHLAIAGIGTYFLCRTIGLGRTAAMGGALALDLGGLAIGLASWSPLILGSYVWLPLAMLFCERVLEHSRPAAAIGLAVVLTFQFLAGFPQLLVFTYELMGLRILWDLVTRRSWPRRRSLALLVCGFSLPALLSAAQLLPAIEVFRESVRSLPMTSSQHGDTTNLFPWRAFRHSVATRFAVGGGVGVLFSAVGLSLAGSAFGEHRSRRIAAFYLLAAVLFVVITFPTPLRDFYHELPVVGDVRKPLRFVWVAHFCLAVLIAHGIEAFPRAARRGPRVGSPAALGALAGAVAFACLSIDGLRGWEVVLLLCLVFAFPIVALYRNAEQSVRVAILALLICNFLMIAVRPYLALVAKESQWKGAEAAFGAVRSRWTPQDRVYPYGARKGAYGDLALRAKSPSLYQLPSIFDYEHLTSRRFATVFVRMTSGQIIRTAQPWIGRRLSLPRNRPLFDLLGARYVIVDETKLPLLPPLVPVWSGARFRVLENPQALPRARYVPRARVIETANGLLNILASGSVDPRRLLLLEQMPSDGFLGSDEAAQGDVAIESARSEELVISVTASREGFLVLSDQHFPGWSAQINGRPVEILRANYAFRAVHVPGGASTVVFRYAPASAVVGAAVSLVAWVGIGVALLLQLRKRPHDSLRLQSAGPTASR
jgi:hypothetical protein